MKNFIKICHPKRFGMIQIFAIFLTFIFASCSNLFGKTDLENSSSSENQNASLVINLKSQSRYIAAQDYDISQINSWALSYTQLDIQNSEPKVITWISGSQIPSSSSPSLTYSSENQTLIINDIPSGTYTIAITGKQTPIDSSSSTSVELFGSATGVKISNDSSATQIYLGLKKSASGSGTFSLTLTDSKNQFDNYYSSLQITLRNIFDDTKYYMFDPSGATTSTLKFEKSSEQTSDTSTSAVYILSNAEGTTITSGFYQLIFYIDDIKSVYIPADKSIIEIADGIETLGETEIFLSRSKTYYSTNDKNALGNGLSKSSPANLSTLLNKLAETLPDEGEINICSDDVPEINIDSLEKIKSKLLGQDSKYISIYDKTQSEILLRKTPDSSGVSAKPSLMIASNTDETGGSSESTVLVDISGALTLTAGEKTQALINIISVPRDSPYKITLKNGASLNVSDDVANRFVGNLQISLVQEDDFANLTDNFASYFAKPFIEFKSSSISSRNFEFYDSENQQVTNWNVEQKNLTSTSSETSYAYYLLPQNQTQLSSAQDYPNAQIKANLAGDSQTTYSSASIIPYKSEILEFTLSFSSEDSSQISNYAWFLEENLFQSSNQSDLVKLSYSLSNFKNAKTYNLSCYFVLDEKIYKTDFKLNFEQIEKSAAVYLDAINYTQSDYYYYYNLKQVEDYKGSDSGLDFIGQYTSTSYESATVSEPIYTFDSNFSLYVPVFSDTRVSSINRYLMSSSDKSYITGTEFVPSSESFNAANSELQDIYYNNENDYLYMLFVEYSDTNIKTPKSGILYASNGSGNIYSSSNIIISSSNPSETPDGTTVNVVPMQIAINGDKLYVAGSDCNIYSTTINFTPEDSSQITVGDFESLASCTESLTGYDENLHNDGEISITDMQLGDGLGNENEKLYVLVREASKTLGYSLNQVNVETSEGTEYYYVVFSRGALLGIDTSTSTKDLQVYGWAESYQDKSENKVRYFGPSSVADSPSVEFFGPSRFAAVVPKKLVILDDGFYIDGLSTQGYSIVKNKDSFVEFDIASSALTRGNENISVTKPSVSSGFTVE